MVEDDPVVRFARDFSGNDTALVERVRGFLAQPPAAKEDVGFYGVADFAPRTRCFLGAVNLLDLAGHLQSVEDKYTFEILHRWRSEGLVDPAAFPREADTVFATILDEARIAAALADAESRAAFRDAVWPIYATATRQLESQINARGRTLLSVDATPGDTLFFALVDDATAQRWRDTALSEEAGYRAGVRSVMWDRFWPHLLSSLGQATIEDFSRFPPGVDVRSDTIPFAP